MREWLMRLIAGNRPFWLHDRVKQDFATLPGNPLGVAGGAAIALAHEAERMGLTEAAFTVGNFSITIRATPPRESGNGG